MSANYQEYMRHADEVALTLTKSSQNWTAFLTTDARLYKYPYHEQLMIYSQRPEATACAEFDVWNNQMRRYIKRGSKGIFLSDGKNSRYVFDVSDTDTKDRNRPFKLWEYKSEHETAVSKMLSEKYNAKGSGIYAQIENAVKNSATEYWTDNHKNIIDIVANSFLEGYDEYNIQVNFIEAVNVSAMYAVLSRCGLEPDEYFEHEDFLTVFDFNTEDTIAELGTATSQINQRILRDIELTIKNYERAKLKERNDENDRTDLHETRGLLPPEPDLSRNESDLRQIRNDERGILEGTQAGTLEQDDSSRRVSTAPERDRQDGEREDRSDDAGADEIGGSDRAAQTDRPDEMGGLDERLQGTGGGNNTERANIQLSLFPTEEEQFDIIEQAESNDELPFAFSISETDFDNLLRLGSNTHNARMIIVSEFSKNKSLQEKAEFLKAVFHGGFGIKGEIDDFSAWYSDDGILTNRGTSVRHSKNAELHSWDKAAERIDFLLQNGQFASNVELEEAPGYERKQIADSLWYLHSDLSEEAKNLGYLNILNRDKFLGFPDETAELAENLQSSEFRATVETELASLIKDYETDKSLIRFKYHKPNELLKSLRELSVPRVEYSSDMAEIPDVSNFITDDEIDENLCGGSGVEGGRGRIYAYFNENHTLSEKANFLKDEYGIGGGSHALSRSDGSSQDHNAKGISFKKTGCTEIQMSWNIVAKRIDNLIKSNRYFTPQEKAEFEEIQRTSIFDGIYGEYNAVKENHPSDIVLFQVGDFFEMYGEDARNAAKILDIYVTQRAIRNVGAVDMCGVPSFVLNDSVEVLREKYPVTINAINSETNERKTYSLPKILPVIQEETKEPSEPTQDDIDNFIRNWNGNTESKRRVNEYMSVHGREREAAEWLKNEYEQDRFIVSGDGLISAELSWTVVQRTVVKMVLQDTFLSDEEREIPEYEPEREIIEENFDNEYLDDELASIYGGDTSESQKQIAEEMAEQYSEPDEKLQTDGNLQTEDYSQYIGREIEVDDRRFIVDRINDLFETVSLRDITFQNSTGFPIFRNESLDWLKRVIDGQEQTQDEIKTETVAVYPAEENNLPYDIEIRTISVNEPEIEVGNFRITDDNLGEGGAKAKFRANMDAINLLKELEFEGRQATEAEQEVLSRYVGWGGLADAFDESKENWADEFKELYTALSPEEYEGARASTLNAHYTSPTVIRAMYQAIENMGFTKGNILEPSMGVGNFFGMLPDSMSGSNLYGIELDSITGRIAKQLYPKADITVAGFETTDRRDFYDLAVGNVPFGNYQVSDKAYNKLGFSIHNYFFAKAIDQVRPGGVIAFVTSRYTMDMQSPEVRKYIAERAELLGAIRLPNNAFKANAGTSVVSDIIFLQKRESPVTIEPDWVHLGENKDGFAINSYFIDNPQMVLGRETSESTQYGKQDFTVEPFENTDLSDLLSEAIKNIQGTYTQADISDSTDNLEVKTIPADPNVKNYSYTVVDGEIYFRRNSVMEKADLNQTAIERVKGMIELRDCVRELIDKQMDYSTTDEEIKSTQAELNRIYDAYVKKYGIINSRANSLAFADDSSYYLLCSLEIPDEDKVTAKKADMFTKRTIKPHKAIESVDTASEALALSISEKACVDMGYMSHLTGKTEDELADELRGVIFKDMNRTPDGAYTYRTADEFLSGNVREKLAYYENALELLDGTDKADFIRTNIEALKSAQPQDLDASEIEVRLGATWIDKEYIKEFMWETFDMPYYLRRSIELNYSPFTAEWNISNKNMASYNDVNIYMTYGTERANAFKILEETLNLRDIRIYDTKQDADGKERRVLNSKETTLAQQKQQVIKDEFRDWIWRDADRRQELVKKYNELFNSTRPREYDGSHISFPGMNPEITLREHQLNAVAHILYGGNTLLAHEVGAGKTFEMVAAAMESKRLGLCQKALFVVPNHLTEQWASEFLRLYPSANILAATKKDFEPQNRKKFCARIATGDYDAVIIGHSQFERIPVSQERQEQLIYDQIDEIEQGLEELKASRAERFTIKSLERTKKSLEARLKKLQDSDRKDDVITFEQLGVDRLYVDEAHAFKNLFLYTKMRNVAGLSTSDAQKSSDMLLKCRYIDEMTDSKGVVFATGTPVSNSMTELYTMMRYLQHDTIREKGLAHFDCWASTFGETTTAIELAPEGTGYRARTRFAKFFNLPELMNLFKEAADIKTSDQLDLPTPKAIYHNVVAQPTEIQKGMVQELSERAAKVHSGAVDASVDNMLKITSDGRKLGLDQRIINPDLPDEPQSKVNLCVDNIFKIYEDGQADKLTQLVFCDLSTPKNITTSKRAAKTPGGNLDSPELHALEQLTELDDEQEFTVYDDIRDKLVSRGIPREEIAFIHEANTEVRKKDLYAKVRSGQVRILMGSTFKMGAGMNVQDRLIALHDLDCPWRPGDLEQRSGRIIRQGNRNEEVHIYRYVTESTFDAYLWQTIENKQKFISQIMTSKSPVRSCEDIDETALSYAEIKALCAGDERIKEKMDLDIDVAKLKLMKANHKSQQYRLEDNLLKHFPEEIERNKGFIEGFEQDIKTLESHPHPQDGFYGMTVRGDTLTDKENAGAALLDAFKEVKGLDPVPIGNYRGFNMFLTLEDFGKEYVLTLKGKMTHKVTLGKDARGNLTRIDNALNGIEKRLETAKERLESLYVQVENAKAELGKPFPQEEELRVKSARLAELNAELNIDERTPMEQAIDENGDKSEETPEPAEPTNENIAKSERPSLLAKLQRPLPNRKSEHKSNELEV